MPSVREFHTLTLISETKAVLFGGSEGQHGTLGDCWLLDLVKAKRPQEDPSSIWTKCLHHGRPYRKRTRSGTALQKLTMRQKHSATLEPYSQRLWIMGGNIYYGEDDDMEYSSDMLMMSFHSATPLRLLAMERVLRCLQDADCVWKTLGFPEYLWDDLESLKKSMVGERHTSIMKPLRQLAIERVIRCLLDAPNVWRTLEIPNELWSELDSRKVSMWAERHT